MDKQLMTKTFTVVGTFIGFIIVLFIIFNGDSYKSYEPYDFEYGNVKFGENVKIEEGVTYVDGWTIGSGETFLLIVEDEYSDLYAYKVINTTSETIYHADYMTVYGKFKGMDSNGIPMIEMRKFDTLNFGN